MFRKDAPREKEVFWVGTTKEDLSKFPQSVKLICGHALYLAQRGMKHQDAKPMKGKLSSVMEICADDDGNTFRTVYTTKIGVAVYALHAFQKKASDGIRTPQRHLDLIAQRLKEAKEHYEWFCKESGTAKRPTSRPAAAKKRPRKGQPRQR
jgi:phage-related protein